MLASSRAFSASDAKIAVMCGRFTLVAPSALARRYPRIIFPPSRPRYNVAPSQPVLTVRNDAPHAAEELVWGLVPNWTDPSEKPGAFINARVESVMQKPAFRESFELRRAVVFADGYYEWGTLDGQKQPYHIAYRDRAPFAFAALWDEWIDAQGARVRTCAIMTRDAHPQVAGIHHRMPVIVNDELIDAWLAKETPPEAARELLVPNRAEELEAVAVSQAVNRANIDTPSLIEPIIPVRQERLF